MSYGMYHRPREWAHPCSPQNDRHTNTEMYCQITPTVLQFLPPKIESDSVGNAGKPWSWLVGMKSQLQYHHYISIPGELEAYQIAKEMGFWKKAGQFSVKSLEHVLNPVIHLTSGSLPSY